MPQTTSLESRPRNRVEESCLDCKIHLTAILEKGTDTTVRKTRQNGENVNPFGAMASVAGDRSGPWTGWIGLAPV